jgi:hypothetical protein
LLYAVETDEGSLFYGVDTAALPEETWQALHRARMKFDLVVLDHTYGPQQPGSDHLCAREVGEHVQRMRAEGLLKPAGHAFATHIAHEGNPAHPELARLRGRMDMRLGMMVEVEFSRRFSFAVDKLRQYLRRGANFSPRRPVESVRTLIFTQDFGQIPAASSWQAGNQRCGWLVIARAITVPAFVENVLADHDHRAQTGLFAAAHRVQVSPIDIAS